MAYDHASLGFEQNADVPAGDTPCRGVLYRSKLIAQWAAFFDGLRIEHVYQPRTFCLAGTTPFTPDFWLPALNAWLVVRPADPVIRDADRWKTELFAREHSSCRVWVSSGAPRAGEWHIEQLGGLARPIARALLLADAALPAERVWVCGANDDSDRLVFDPIDVAGCSPDIRLGCPANPNQDTVMRIAYGHVERFDSDGWIDMGALSRRRLAHPGFDRHPA
jgi:hypothetical protein